MSGDKNRFRDLGILTIIIVGVSTFLVLANLAAIYFETQKLEVLDGLRFLSRETQALEFERSGAIDASYAMTVVLQSGLFLINAGLFCLWLFGASINAHLLSNNKMAISPGWAVGWFFVPFANLVKPYEAVREIWAVSESTNDWDSNSSSFIIPLWWGLWIFSGFIGGLAGRLSLRAETTQGIKSTTQMLIISDGLDVLLLITFVIVVTGVWKSQKKSLMKTHMGR